MAKAKKEKLVSRIVVGPKGIHAIDPKTGDRYYAEIGTTVKLTARAAKAFERYLEAPGVAAAKAAVAKAEVDADAKSEADAEAAAEAEADAKAVAEAATSADDEIDDAADADEGGDSGDGS